MKLYQSKGSKLKAFKAKPFKLEKNIQQLVEGNLKDLFDLDFVKSEFTVKSYNSGSFRIDTLAYNSESNSFVIIEYKRDKNYSVIDQGYTYLSLLLNNKSDFILEYNESCDGSLKRADVDWSQSRVIFISPHFTEYQKHSVNFKDVPFELWEIKRYEGDLIGLIEHRNSSSESISTISSDPEDVVNKVTREVKVYTEEYHFTRKKKMKQSTLELYNSLRDRILGLGDDIEIIPRSEHISFKRNRPFTDLVLYVGDIRCLINMKIGQLDDPKEMTRDVSEIGHWGNGDYEVKIESNTDLDYLMFLVKQSYIDKQ